jgi:hypothetical protein
MNQTTNFFHSRNMSLQDDKHSIQDRKQSIEQKINPKMAATMINFNKARTPLDPYNDNHEKATVAQTKGDHLSTMDHADISVKNLKSGLGIRKNLMKNYDGGDVIKSTLDDS